MTTLTKNSTFNEVVATVVERFQSNGKRDLGMISMDACEEAGGTWNYQGVQTAAYKQIWR